jgi:uncharacterized protein (DUF302 family)
MRATGESTVKSSKQTVTRICAIAFLSLVSTAALAADKYGIFESIHQSSADYDTTVQAVAEALEKSAFVVHARHEVRVPDEAQKAHVFVLTSPEYQALAENESPRTVSAQVLRVAVYTWGEDQQTLVNMANPVPHAMLFYAQSDNYDALLEGADGAAGGIRAALAELPGEAVSGAQASKRTEKHYRKYKGDGPARMMTKFRTFRKSQLLIHETDEAAFDATVAAVQQVLEESKISDAEESTGWEPIAKIAFGDDVTYYGISNPYIEDKMIRINSGSRKDRKSDSGAYPGTDHVAALPTEILIVKEEGKTRVLHYGQMWRMQLYFWDSGYGAFTANVGVPSKIANSIKDLLAENLE